MGDSFKKIDSSVIVNRSKINKENIDSDNESVSSPEEAWYKRPIGLIVIGILIVIIGRYIAYKLGW